MNTEQLEQIKARAEEAAATAAELMHDHILMGSANLDKIVFGTPALAADVLALLAERERLAAELRELQWMMDGLRK
jgi:hypothetical protein